jgi:hypothetical protein
MLTKIINGNTINAGSAVHITPIGGIYSSDTKYPKALSQDGQYDFNEESHVFVPLSGGIGTIFGISGVPNRQLTIDSFSLSANSTSNISFFSSGTGASPISQTLLAGPYQTVAGTLVTGGPFRTRVGENLVINNSTGLIGGSLVYRIE